MTFTFPQRSHRAPQRPEMFTTMASRIPARDERLRQTVDKMAKAYSDLVEQGARFEKDQTITPGARLVKLAKLAKSKIVPLMDEYEAAVGSIVDRQNFLRGEIDKVLNPPNKPLEMVMRHQEIRALFRAMPRTQALEALERSRQSGDEDTVIALVGPQPYLSGLPPELYQHGRDHLIEKYVPEQAAAIKALDEQVSLAGGFRSEIANSVASLVDFAKADEIIAAAREDAAAA